jgi:hypothetical protein
MRQPQNILKFIIGWIVCLGIRMLPFRPPNIEPIMTTTMPFSKRWGWLAGALFAAASIVIYDILVPTPGFARIGIWTFVTAVMYGLVGIAAGVYMKNREIRVRHYLGFAIIATIVYDFVTGPVMSSLIFGMTFAEAFTGQIPFTIMHLLGNIVFSVTLSPLLYKWVVSNKSLELDSIKQRFTITG